MSPPTHDRPTVPRLLLLTERRLLRAGADLVEAVAKALAGGVGGVVVRERDLPMPTRTKVGQALRQAAIRHDAVFAWAWPPPDTLLLSRAGESTPFAAADAVHLRADDRFPTPRPRLVGRSCHTVEELERAADEMCDYVTLSPVAATATKPGHGPRLGPAGFGKRLRHAAYDRSGSPRVLALGGVTPELVRPLLDAGAHGVAVMGHVLRASDPRAAAAELAAEVSR